MLAGYLAKSALARSRYAAMPQRDSYVRMNALRNVLRIHSVLEQLGQHFNYASDILGPRPGGDALLHGHSHMMDVLRPEDFAQQIDQLIDAGGEESPSILPYLQALHRVFTISQALPRPDGGPYMTDRLLDPQAARQRRDAMDRENPVGMRNFRLAMNNAYPAVIRAGFPAFQAVGRNAIGGNIDAMGTSADMLDAARTRRDLLSPANFAEIQDAKHHLLGIMRQHVHRLEDTHGGPFYAR